MRAVSRRRLTPDERRTELVAAARRLFAAQGVENTSVSEIVKAAGVAQGTFYWYFASKQEALNAVVQEMTDEFCATASAVADAPSLSGPEKLRRLWAALLASVAQDGESLAHFHAEGDHLFHDQLTQEVTRRLAPVLSRIIRQGVAEGAFTTTFPEEAAAFVLAAYGVVYDEAFFLEREPAAHRAEALMDFVWRGLGCGKPRPGPGEGGEALDR